MGAPKVLTAAQKDKLQGLTRDLPESDRAVTVGSNGSASVTVPMHSNDLVLVKLTPKS